MAGCLEQHFLILLPPAELPRIQQRGVGLSCTSHKCVSLRPPPPPPSLPPERVGRVGGSKGPPAYQLEAGSRPSPCHASPAALLAPAVLCARQVAWTASDVCSETCKCEGMQHCRTPQRSPLAQGFQAVPSGVCE